MNSKSKGTEIIWRVVFLVLSIVVGVGFAMVLYINNAYPEGSDVYGHLYKINYLVEALRAGVWYPMYAPSWYNSIELFRYWPPFSYYVVAVVQIVLRLDIYNAFLVFAGLAYVINMYGWYKFAKDYSSYVSVFLIGTLYFFAPDNLRVFFSEGNIPRIFISALLPLVFYQVHGYLEMGKKRSLIYISLLLFVITTSHFMIAAMVGVSIFLYLLIHACATRQWSKHLIFLLFSINGYILAGILLVTGLTGGLVSQSSESSVSTISSWAQEAYLSLNPFYRIGQLDVFYFGLGLFIVCVIGFISANRKTMPGFLAGLLIFFSTTTVVTPVIELLPLSQVFWMQRFIPMATCFIFMALIYWNKLRKSVLAIFVLLMVVDSIPSFGFVMEESSQPVEMRVETSAQEILLPDAIELTGNRLAIIDGSLFGSLPSYYLSKDGFENTTHYSFGWAFQGAKTVDNIVQINEAFDNGFYFYMFDRLLELGDDTVLVDKAQIPEESRSFFDYAAESVGYTLAIENDSVILLKYEEVTGQYGTLVSSDCIAIGRDSQYISYIYPQFIQGKSDLLDDYTYEELEGYSKIYLSAFDYEDKEMVEEMLDQLATNGTQIYIDMQNIPVDRLTGKNEFLGVYAQFIAFTETFPVFEKDDTSQFKLPFNTDDYAVWNTVYLSGLTTRLKTSFYDTQTNLAYVGTNENENLIFIGFNPVFYYITTGHEDLLEFLNEVFDLEPNGLPERTIVPITITYDFDEVIIESDYDNVNTNLAFLDCFVPSQEIMESDSLMIVSAGTTILTMQYPYFAMGLVVSCIGLVIYGILIFFFVIRKDKAVVEKVGEEVKKSEVPNAQESQEKYL
ncbi:MAG: 6-pyruvoyl-tetrahydropterin synthase-related protein [Eubacteriales bacterium]